MKKTMMELIDKGFSQKIADRYTNLKLFTTNFSTIISTKRVIPRVRWLELVYAMPYLVLRREILNSFKRTKNFFASAKQIWNIFVHLEFPLSRYKYLTTRLHRFSREKMQIHDTRYKMQIKPVSDLLYPVSSSYVNHVKSRDFYFAYPYAHIERETLQNGQKMISYFKSSSMEFAQPVSYETSKRETKKESPVKNYQLPVVTHQPPVVSHKPSAVRYEDQATYILRSASDITTPLFSYYSFKPTLFLSQKTVPIMQRGVSSIAQKSDATYPPYGHLERETLQNGQRIISYFNFKMSSMELAQPVSRETTRIETEKESTVTHQPPLVSHKPSAVSYKNQETYILPGTIDFTTPSEPLEREALKKEEKIISYFKPSSMKLAQSLSQETAEIETEKELAVTNYQLPIVTRLLSTISHKPTVVSNKSVEKTSILPSAKDFITTFFSYYPVQKIKTDMGEKAIYDILPYFNFMNNKQRHLNTSEVEKAKSIYRTYPKIEHVTSTHTEIIKERVIEKEIDSKPSHETPQLPSIDVNRLTDQIYQLMERKVRIERERRGLLCR